MIQARFNLEEKPKNRNKRKDDATDALGIALCYALNKKSKLA